MNADMFAKNIEIPKHDQMIILTIWQLIFGNNQRGIARIGVQIKKKAAISITMNEVYSEICCLWKRAISSDAVKLVFTLDHFCDLKIKIDKLNNFS